MLRLERSNHSLYSLVICLDPSGKLGCRFRALINEIGTPIRGRNIYEQKLAPAIRVDIQNQTFILSHELRNKDAGLVLPECISTTSRMGLVSVAFTVLRQDRSSLTR